MHCKTFDKNWSVWMEKYSTIWYISTTSLNIDDEYITIRNVCIDLSYFTLLYCLLIQYKCFALKNNVQDTLVSIYAPHQRQMHFLKRTLHTAIKVQSPKSSSSHPLKSTLQIPQEALHNWIHSTSFAMWKAKEIPYITDSTLLEIGKNRNPPHWEMWWTQPTYTSIMKQKQLSNL